MRGYLLHKIGPILVVTEPEDIRPKLSVRGSGRVDNISGGFLVGLIFGRLIRDKKFRSDAPRTDRMHSPNYNAYEIN